MHQGRRQRRKQILLVRRHQHGDRRRGAGTLGLRVLPLLQRQQCVVEVAGGLRERGRGAVEDEDDAAQGVGRDGRGGGVGARATAALARCAVTGGARELGERMMA